MQLWKPKQQPLASPALRTEQAFENPYQPHILRGITLRRE